MTAELKTYRVEWLIDIEAETPRKAAGKALEIQRDEKSNAIVYAVFERDNPEGFGGSIDLTQEDEDDPNA